MEIRGVSYSCILAFQFHVAVEGKLNGKLISIYPKIPAAWKFAKLTCITNAKFNYELKQQNGGTLASEMGPFWIIVLLELLSVCLWKGKSKENLQEKEINSMEG